MGDQIDYIDFEITVTHAGENDYIVRAQSGREDAEVRFTNPFNVDKQELIDATLTKSAMRRSSKTRGSSAPEVKKMKEFGSLLFDQAITGPVRDFYYKCRGLADQDNKGIRWRLSLDSSVGNLPWEFMYCQDDFLALDPKTPIVRYIKGAARVAPLKEAHPLRLLVVIARPIDETPLDTTAEKDLIIKSLEPLTDQGLIELSFIEGPNTWERLIDALLPNSTHILHFIGHGAFDEKNNEGVLVMEDADRKAMRIDSERLRVLMKGKSGLRLVVLNSCLGTEASATQPFSSVAAGLVKSGVPAVIAMQFEISDDAAREIAQTFYQSLAYNFPVDASLTEARRQVFLLNRDSLEWATPILYMQVPDGQLFQFTTESKGADTGPLTIRGTGPSIAKLVRLEGGEEIPLFGAKLRIGRDKPNDIPLSDPTVSRKHATITCADSTFTIENEPKSSGTWVNGQQITKRVLRDGDTIRLGGVEFGFRTTTAAPVKSKRPPRHKTQPPPPVSEEKPAAGGSGLPAPQQPAPVDYYAKGKEWADKGKELWAGMFGSTPAPTPAPTPGPGALVPTSPAQPPAQPTSASGYAWRMYEMPDPDLKQIAETVRNYFYNNDYESQLVQEESTWVVQGRKAGWIRLVGMGKAATVVIEPAAAGVKVSIGGAPWLEKGAVLVAAGLLTGGLTFITSAIGMVQQQQLMDELWRVVKMFTEANGGQLTTYG